MRKLFVALALVIACAPVPAHAAGCDGVTVVVDFRSLGGGVQQGCAPGSPASGVAALTAAGFGYTYASRQPGFVCRINAKPGTDADKCVNASPATAYWSYWHAPAGGAWSYSNQGAATFAPARGTVEGWAFGAGEQPGIAPPAAPAPQPQLPAPPPPPATKPPVQQPPATTTTTAPPVSSEVPTSSSAESAPPTTTASSSVAAPSSTAVAEKAQRTEEKSTWPWTVLGALVIIALAVAGLLVARRRRSVDE
ncbi:hypothetical protein [Lentzea sp. NPDC059081]|uniref:hypothetical protein n=1 Tax=Lentzea sp. NPDC059081 TaxID=3346719 RepID=UPI00368CF31E